ncbi:restriction endonuclease subunit S [Laspinema olomoucense]|uniref:Restriction endonuclease subunit S n=1 Tax=Laspinema olomoucense D3b TaxID=2953688 RepID=A0ABT2N782_9CYAN|nr:restriction endonuclease subunit S [Laspinema sp. D3b]MCT7977151.1 restriction endonuclease subunit S [Laspinema sp. D3b]
MSKKLKKNVPVLRFPEFEGAWETKNISDICTRISDGIHSTPEYSQQGEFYFINGNNLINSKIEISENTKRVDYSESLKYASDLNSQTILISINGTIGNLAFYENEKVILGKSACYLNLKPEKNKIFIFYLLQTSTTRNHFNRELTGSTIKNLSLTTIKNTEVYLPLIAEQEKIASFLGAVDTRLNQLRRKREHLQTYKRGVMQKLFSQQICFTQPDGSPFPDWEKKKLGNISEKPQYGLAASAIKFDGKHKYIRITDIDDNTHGFTPNPLTSPDSGISPDYQLQDNDLVLARTGATVGKSYLYKKEDGEIYFAGYLIRFRITKAHANFVYYLTLTDKYYKWVIMNSMRSGQPGINAEEYSNFSFFLPCKKEQEKIANFLTIIDRKIEILSCQIDQTEQFKKGLLQKLFV